LALPAWVLLLLLAGLGSAALLLAGSLARALVLLAGVLVLVSHQCLLWLNPVRWTGSSDNVGTSRLVSAEPIFDGNPGNRRQKLILYKPLKPHVPVLPPQGSNC
jgi:hypothetical protein